MNAEGHGFVDTTTCDFGVDPLPISIRQCLRGEQITEMNDRRWIAIFAATEGGTHILQTIASIRVDSKASTTDLAKFFRVDQNSAILGKKTNKILFQKVLLVSRRTTPQQGGDPAGNSEKMG